MLYRLVFLACALLGAGVVMARGNPHAPALLQMHEEFVEAFVKSQGFGEARITPMVLTMREYQFTHVGDTGLCVADVDLIGIARDDPPVAFNAGLVGLMHVERKRPLYR